MAEEDLWFKGVGAARGSLHRTFVVLIGCYKKFDDSHVKLVLISTINMEALIHPGNIRNACYISSWELHRSKKTIPCKFIGIGVFKHQGPIGALLSFIQGFFLEPKSYVVVLIEIIIVQHSPLTICRMRLGKTSNLSCITFVFFNNPNTIITHIQGMDGDLEHGGSTGSRVIILGKFRHRRS